MGAYRCVMVRVRVSIGCSSVESVANDQKLGFVTGEN